MNLYYISQNNCDFTLIAPLNKMFQATLKQSGAIFVLNCKVLSTLWETICHIVAYSLPRYDFEWDSCHININGVSRIFRAWWESCFMIQNVIEPFILVRKTWFPPLTFGHGFMHINLYRIQFARVEPAMPFWKTGLMLFAIGGLCGDGKVSVLSSQRKCRAGHLSLSLPACHRETWIKQCVCRQPAAISVLWPWPSQSTAVLHTIRSVS